MASSGTDYILMQKTRWMRKQVNFCEGCLGFYQFRWCRAQFAFCESGISSISNAIIKNFYLDVGLHKSDLLPNSGTKKTEEKDSV